MLGFTQRGYFTSVSLSPALQVLFAENRRTKMNHCGIQQNSNFSSFGNGEPVVCPKPRRLNTTVNHPVQLFRLQMCYQPEQYESKSSPELLDIIYSPEQSYSPVASSPPFFCGSPPSRVSNPLIQDARFGDNKIYPISPKLMIPNPNSGIQSSSPPPTSRNNGFLRSNYSNKPSVRVEGFNCLDSNNRRNCSVSALA
ncbi:hypothetical protein QVD17_31931 [Tagetes erecta]|uniref:Uncharacterized protein n=1 Tax=Tagetes erecta TaxID=13708 RepID=A0AAD8K552_TARER|nr:hypothetical protein QVD17_31931 [Tagetes erecta]